MQFNEIRSLEKIHRSEEGFGTDNLMEVRGIVHPGTKEIITVGEAISLRILDVRNGRIATSTDGKTSISIEDAARVNLIDEDLAKRLLGPCGITEDGRRISLLEAIQREILDAERGDDRVKVTYVATGGISVDDAMKEGLLDPETGRFITASGEKISIEEAYSRGYLARIKTIVNIKQGAVALSDAISQGLVDDKAGRVMDRNTGDSHLLDEAIARGIIDSGIREVVDTRIDSKITVSEAIGQGLLNPKSGKYLDDKSMEKLTLKEARRRQLIVKPLTLKDCCDLEIIDENGKIASPAHKTKLGILEAISRGVLDSDRIKSISDTRNGEFLNLSDALACGIIQPEGKYRDASTGRILTIPEAVDKGLITSVSQKSIFDIDGFKDPVSGEFISLNAALLKGLVSPKAGGSFVIDLKTGKTLSLNEATEQGYARPEVMEMLNRGIGIIERGQEVSVIEAVLLGLLDPQSGQLLDPRTKKIVPLEEAIRRGLITPDGAALLASMLNITVTTQTMTKTIKKYVTITETGETITKDYKMSFAEAISKNLIDEKTGEFYDPDSGKVMSIQDAIRESLLGDLSESQFDNFSPKRMKEPKQMSFETTVIRNIGGTNRSRDLSPPKAVGTTTTIISREIVSPSRENFMTSPLSVISEASMSVSPSDSIGQRYETNAILELNESRESSVSTRENSISPTKRESVSPTRIVISGTPMNSSTSPSKEEYVSKPDEHHSEPMEFEYTNPSQDRDNKWESVKFIEHESSDKSVFQMPVDGWMLSEAIKRNIFDPETGMCEIPGTDRLVSFDECVKLRIINQNSAVVVDPSNGRNVSLLRSIDKGILNSTGHYTYPQNITMKEAIAQGSVILEDKAVEIKFSTPKLLQITKESGGVDNVGISKIDDPTKQAEVKNLDEANILDPVQVKHGVIYDPATALLIFTESGKSADLLTAINEGDLQPEVVVVEDPRTGKQIGVKDAIKRGILDSNKGYYKDKNGKGISLVDATKLGLVAVLGAPLVAAAAAVEAVKKAMIEDPRTGEKIPREVAIERGLVEPDKIVSNASIIVEDPQTELEIPASETMEKNIIIAEELHQAITLPGSKEIIEVPEKSNLFFDEVDEAGPSLGEKTRSRVTTEPKYKVTIGRARSLSRSPEREAKPIVLQKMRKKIVRPKEALETGLMDRETANVLETKLSGDDGEPLTLSEAIKGNKIDANKGTIVDPQKGEPLTINEALQRGILDPESADMLVPIAKSISIPDLYKQGLIEPQEGKIIHPETGAPLNLNDAIVCEILDPSSKLSDFSGKKVTVASAIVNNIIDPDKSLVKTKKGDLSLVKAIEADVFDSEDHRNLSEIPPAGMTFPVALKRGLVDAKRKGITHPITGEHLPLEEAIKTDFIMALPYPAAPDSIEVTKALDSGLIDQNKGVLSHPKTGEQIPVSEAVESGLLVIKPQSENMGMIKAVTETITSYHTITTKTVELAPGFVLVSPTEVQDINTGKIISVEEATKKGIVRDESENNEEFTTRDIKTTFSDAVEQGLVDMDAGTYKDPNSGTLMPIGKAVEAGILNTSLDISELDTRTKSANDSFTVLEAFEQICDEKTEKFQDPVTQKIYDFTEAIEAGLIESDSVVYDVKSTESVTTKEAIEKGLLDPKTGKLKDQKGESMSVADAAKLGLLAVVAAPILAGKAVIDAVKSKQNDKSSSVPKKDVSTKEVPIKEVPVNETRPIQTKGIPSFVSEKNMQIEEIDEPMESIIVTTVQEAIENKRIDPSRCRIFIQEKELPYTVHQALREGQIGIAETIEILSKTKISILEGRPRFKIAITQDLTPEYLAEQYTFDLETERFTDPSTGNIVAFNEFVLGLEIFDPDNVIVKDITSKIPKYVTLREAIERPLLDRNVGYMVDPKSGKKIPFFEAIRLGWIVEKQAEVIGDYPTLSLEEAIEFGTCDPVTGQVHDPTSGKSVSLASAIKNELVDPDSVSIRNPVTDEILPLSEAIEAGIIDLTTELIVNIETKIEVDMKTAFLKGLVVPRLRKPISLEAIIKKGLYEPETGKIQDTFTNQYIDVEEGVRRGIIDAFITECQDTKAGSFLSLDDALSVKLINPITGRLRDTKAGKLLPLDRALKKGLIITTPFIPTLIDIIVQEYYSPKTGLVLNPVTGEEITVGQALSSEYVDGRMIKIKDERQDKALSIQEAEESGLLDLDKGMITFPHPMTLDVAFEKGYILSTLKPWTLQEALAHQSYDPKTGNFVIDGERFTLEEAISKGVISQDGSSIKDPRTSDIISLGDAIKHGFIDPKSGTALDPSSGIPLTLTDALDRGLVVPAKRKISLPEAVFKGFYDPKTGQFTSPETQEKLPTDRAIQKGVIDPASAIVRDVDGELITFKKAIKDLIVDPKAGTITNSRGYPIDFHEAFEQGILLETRRPMSFSEAILKGILDEKTGTFLDPQNGNHLTLIQTITNNLIDADSVIVKDTRSDFWKKISLIEAIETGYIDGNTGHVKNTTKGEKMSLIEAYDTGIVIDKKAAVSLQRAIHQGLYEEKTGKIIDPSTGRGVTLHEAMRKCIINPILACYWDKRAERVLSLAETCRAGVIDRRAGTFKEPGAHRTISLTTALQLGLIIDIESAGFSLYEVLLMNMYDASSGKFIHPSTNKKLLLFEACQEELINPLTSIVKNSKTDQYIPLAEAISLGIIDTIRGTYNVPDSSAVMDLQDARKKGLIVPFMKPLSIEEAVKSNIYRPDKGKFVNPVTNEFYDLSQAIEKGLIDPETTALKDAITGQTKPLLIGIEDGTIEASKSRILDPTTKRTYNIDIALERGLLVTVDRPLTQQPERRTSVDLQKATIKDKVIRECTLNEAIKYQLLDPKSAVVKDPRTGRFINISNAISDGVIDPSKKGTFEPQTGKIIPHCVKFEDFNVFLSKPLSFETAVDEGYLVLETGKFTDPRTKEVLTLKEVVTLGVIDPDSALIKDTEKKKLVKLPEAFRKGMMDAEKGSVLDTATSKLYTLPKAVDSGLLTTQKQGVSFIEALQYGLYNPTTGSFHDPFAITSILDRKRLTLVEAIESGLVDPSTTVIKDPTSGSIFSLLEAINEKRIDPVKGRFSEGTEGKSIDFNKALEHGYVVAAEARVSHSFYYSFIIKILFKQLVIRFWTFAFGH